MMANVKIRTLYDLGKAIQAVAPNHKVEVQKSWSSTDRKPRDVRWRIVGKGRTGLRITVHAPDGRLVLDHDTSVTYRTVCEAVMEANRILGTEFECGRKEWWRA